MNRFVCSILMMFITWSLYGNDTVVDGIDKRIHFFFEEMANKRSERKSDIKTEIVEINEDNKSVTEQKNINPEILCSERIELLNKSTPIELAYNQYVKKFVDIYSGRRKKEFEKIRGLSDLYFPIFEEKLDKYNLPLELKYLPVVESSLNALAVSPSGAVGLWQFLFNTSNMFDLEINSYIDERRDPVKSTEAACRYFLYLYNIFNDWQLAIASFNGGPGEIRNAIEKSGGKTSFWDLQPYLSQQTKNYVPAFIASLYVLNYADEIGMEKN